MKYCQRCGKEFKKDEKTFKDEICFECYRKILLDQAEKLSREERKNNKNNLLKFLKNLFFD